MTSLTMDTSIRTPSVSVLIPCRSEVNYIRACLDSVIANDYPKERLEICVVDGQSEDGTREAVLEYCSKSPFIRLLDNPKKIVPTAMNIGIRHSGGEIIIRMDAHNTYAKDYISKCVHHLEKTGADNVGGVWVTVPGAPTTIAKSIAIALSHPFGVGNSHFRTGLKKPTFVDTVPFGCYRREVFDKIGLFNEQLVRNQDIELNLRLRSAGGKILLHPDILSYYHARARYKDLARNNFLNGFWVIYSRQFSRSSFSLRHIIPFLFLISIIVSLFFSIFCKPFIYILALIIGLYTAVNIFFSFSLSLRHGIKHFPALFAAFFSLHFSYGLGSFWGFLKKYISVRRASNPTYRKTAD